MSAIGSPEEAPRKRAKVGPGFGCRQAKDPRRKRRLSWGPSGPPPKLARDAAGHRAELTWELEPRPFQTNAQSGCEELALACICPDEPVPEGPRLPCPGSALALVIAPHNGGSISNISPVCWTSRASGRTPLLIADRNVQQSTHRISPPTIKLPCANKQSSAVHSVGASDGVRSCWIEEIDEEDDSESTPVCTCTTSHPAGMFGGSMEENSQGQPLWHHVPDEVSMC